MPGKIEAQLVKLGIAVPKPAKPVANYVPYVVTGSLVFVAGQVPFVDGVIKHAGKVGKNLTIEQGYEAARICGLNIIAQLREACGGDLDRVKRIVRLGGFVAAPADFTEPPKVVNGASDLLVQVFGDAGRHARTAVSVPSLPLDSAVEVDCVAEIA